MTPHDVTVPDPDEALAQLARELGVGTEYWDGHGQHHQVGPQTIRAVLAALGVMADTAEQVRTALQQLQQKPWRRTLPPIVVLQAGEARWVPVHIAHGVAVSAAVELEDGSRRNLPQLDHWVEPRVIDGALVGEATFEIPADLPLGWHRITATTAAGTTQCPLVISPARLELPRALSARRCWGLMTQLYATRSTDSWGIGDVEDLAELGIWAAAEHGADFVLVNPLHAAEAAAPMEPSPYLPTTRRFVNPLYIRVEAIAECTRLAPAARARLDQLAQAGRDLNASAELDRDSSWQAKRAALELIYAVPRTFGREQEFRAFREQSGPGLLDFATWCVLSEVHGSAWRTWPAELQDPRSSAVLAERQARAERVEFYCWLQWVLDVQLATAQRRTKAAGMELGVLHDLAVGVHPDGADAWGLGAALARGVSVGAPPDAFNQQGQDWSQPPWRPDQLAELGYAPYRDMIRSLLQNSGGLRVDHICGLFRLWWVPQGQPPTAGTYVRYDHEALIGILVLEAHRAGAVIIGEDLGVVEPWVRQYLSERGIFGTSVLWFEQDSHGMPLAPEAWRELCLATVTTHDLPPTAGYLRGVHVELREQLGLLTRPVAEERDWHEQDRGRFLKALRDRGFIADNANEGQIIAALHRFISWTPSRLLGVSLSDLVGDRRVINQPGTDEEYPNWRMPLADGNGDQVFIDDLAQISRAAEITRALRQK